MKKLIGFITVVIAVLLLAIAATPPPDKYEYGTRGEVTLTSADTVTVEPNNLTLTYATIALDTNVVINVDVDNSIVGDRIVFHATADATARTLTFGSNITGTDEEVAATKTELMEFIYNGTGFYQVAEAAVD
jgi:hypothetical protein